MCARCGQILGRRLKCRRTKAAGVLGVQVLLQLGSHEGSIPRQFPNERGTRPQHRITGEGDQTRQEWLGLGVPLPEKAECPKDRHAGVQRIQPDQVAGQFAQRDDELPVASGLADGVGNRVGCQQGAFLMATGAQAALAAGEGDEHLVAAVRVADAGEAKVPADTGAAR